MTKMMMHKVLWLDDQWELFEDDFMVQARKKGIELIPFGLREDGINELRLHPDRYEAVLTDASMPENKTNQVESITGVNIVERIAHENHIPVFISTGQPGLTKDTIFRDSHENVFIKGDATDIFGGDDELFEAMLKAFAQQENNTIRRYYADVFAAVSAIGLEEQGTEILLPILCKLHNPEAHADFNPTLHYTQLRIFIEYLFRKFNEYGILSDAFIVEEGKSENGRRGVNLDLSCKYLQGAAASSHIPFKAKEAIFPIQVGRNISSIIYFANTNSHSAQLTQLTEDEEKLVTAELAKPRSKYTLYSFAMMLCECVIWMYGYIQDHPNYAQNQAQWVRIETSEETPTVGGIVRMSRDEGGNIYVGNAKMKYIAPHELSDEELSKKQYRIEAVKANTDLRTKDKYPYFIEVVEI